MIEKANQKFAKGARSVKLPGKAAQPLDTDPVKIARELRANSALGRREAELVAREAKLRG